MIEPNFAGIRTFLKTQTEVINPDITIVGIPFDLGTTIRPGARLGPAAIRDASIMLLSGRHHDLRVSPREKLKILDAGDLKMANGYLEESLKLYEEQLTLIDTHIVALGGDHTISLPLLRSLSNKKSEPVSLIHFDAHLDTWADNYGSPIGHGTPFYYACEEGLIDPSSSVQIGIRAGVDDATLKYTREKGFTIITAEAVHRNGPDYVIDWIYEIVGNRPTYLTFDVDSLDPSQAPGTGTPVVGGLFTWQALAILNQLQNVNWVGMDIVEVAPAYDNADITALAAASVVNTYLCLLCYR